MSSNTRLRKNKGSKKGKSRPVAERSPSPRIVETQRAATRKKNMKGKRKRLSNLSRGAPPKASASAVPAAKVSRPIGYIFEPIKNGNDAIKGKYFSQAQEALQNAVIRPCKKGKQHSVSMIMVMIRMVSLFVTLHQTVTEGCKLTAKLIGASQEVIRRHAMLWFSKKEIRQTGRKRGQGCGHYNTNNHILHQEHLNAISKFVDHNNSKAGGMTSIRQIRNHLQREFGVRYKRSAIYYALRVRLGYKYAVPKTRSVIMTEARRKRLRKHWLQRDLALKAQSRGECILVYMDESYVHQNHFPKHCWFHPDRPKVTRPAGKGKRLIIVHAITRDGLLRYCPLGADNPPSPGEFDSSIHPTAEMVYRAKSARGDYHDQMDCDTFMMWLERRLVPAFESRYPGKTMVLVLDNAPYHHGRRDDGFWCKDHSKADIQVGVSVDVIDEV